jgi:choline monooxygenase
VKNQLARSGSRVYGKWHEEVRRRFADRQPEFGAIWLTYYPNIMVEWYPHVLVVSVVIPRGRRNAPSSPSSTTRKMWCTRTGIR